MSGPSCDAPLRPLARSLARARALASSGVPAQRLIAAVLVAIDQSVAASNASNHPVALHLNLAGPPVAYFGALMSLLEQQFHKTTESSHGEPASVLAAAAYLLAFVFPCVPAPILRLKFDQIADLLALVFDAHSDNAPIVRSLIVCLQRLLVAQDSTAWSSNRLCKLILESLLLLLIDHRPKVRKAAAESLRIILISAPPPSLSHPATARTIDFCSQLLDEFARAISSSAPASHQNRTSGDRSDAEQKVLYCLVFLKSIIPVLASQARADKINARVKKLCAALLAIPASSSRAGNIILTQWVFQVFDVILSSGEQQPAAANDVTEDADNHHDGDTPADAHDQDRLLPSTGNATTHAAKMPAPLIASVVEHLLTVAPHENDVVLAPAWLNLLADGFQRLSEAVHDRELSRVSSQNALASSVGNNDDDDDSDLDAAFCEKKYPSMIASVFQRVFSSYFANASSAKPIVLQRATILLSVLANHAISNSMVTRAATVGLASGTESDSELARMIVELNASLTGIQYRDAWGYILLVASAFMERLGGVSTDLVAPTLRAMFAFRDDPAYANSFPYKDELTRATNSAIQALGLKQFTDIIPLNIENELPDQPRRPYLLASFAEALQMQSAPSQWTPTSVFGPHTIEFFSKSLFPLATRMLEKASTLAQSGKVLEAKLYETLGIQSFDLFPLICSCVPPDVDMHFGKLAPHLGRVLQTVPEHMFPNLPSGHDFRVPVCDGLASLVQAYHDIANLVQDIDQDDDNNDDAAVAAWRVTTTTKAKAAIHKLASYTNRFMSALCNNYTAVNPAALGDTRAKAQALQTLHEREIQRYEKGIRAFLLIAEPNAVSEYFLTLMRAVLERQTELHARAQQQQEQKRQSSSSSHGAADVQDMQEDGADVSAQPQTKLNTPLASSETELERLRMYASLDLAVILLPFLPNDNGQQTQPDSPTQIMYRVLIGQLKDHDANLQKRTYKSLVALVQSLPADIIPHRDLFTRLFDDDVVSQATSGTKRHRIRLVHQLCETVPDSSVLIQFVPVALPEIILATKEASEKTRETAYECLVSMGLQMVQRSMSDAAGSVTDKKGLDGLDTSLMNALEEDTNGDDDDGDDQYEDIEEDEPEGQVDPNSPAHRADVSLREFLLMVVAGLAGTSTHMQSASISSLSRLLFEFADLIDPPLINDLVQTVLVTMQSPHRELVKSALGFIKVAIVCVPQPVLSHHLEPIITAVLDHSRDHKSHFKAKVRHIFERLVRKFSYEAVEGFVTDKDRKLIVNIRKRRDRLKRQKAQTKKQQRGDDDCGDGDPVAVARQRIRDAKTQGFDHALNGSESELGSSDEDNDDDAYIPEPLRDETRRGSGNNGNGNGGGGNRRGRAAARIREDGEDVVDFLDSGVVSKITSARGGSDRHGRRHKRGQAHTDTNGDHGDGIREGDDGRLVVRDDGDLDTRGRAGNVTTPHGSEDYYMQAMKSEAAVVRRPDGRIRFVEKRKRDEDDDGDGGDGGQGPDTGAATSTKGRGSTHGVAGKNGNSGVGGNRWGAKKGDTTSTSAAASSRAAAVDRMLGRHYKAKRAHGDIKKTGMPDPHAYIPLSGHVVGNRRKAARIDEGLRDVLKVAKRGGDVGNGHGGGHGGWSGKKHSVSSRGNKKHK